MEEKFSIGLGFLMLVLAAIAFYIPQILHYESEEPNDEISMAHSDSLGINKIDFNFITRTDPQILYVNYSVKPLNNENGTLSVVIPYQGKVVQTPANWQIKNFSSTNSIVLFKNFTCTRPICPGEDGTIQYDLTNKVDSWRFPNHYTKIPFFSNAPNTEINTFFNDLSRQISWPFSFGWHKADSATLRVTIDKEFDEWETTPISRISSIPNSDGGRNMILEWDLVGSTPIFVVKYSSSIDRTLLFYAQGATGFGAGIGIGLILNGMNTIRNNRQQKKLQNFIEVQRLLQDANTTYTNKDYHLAKIQYDKTIKADPENTEAYVRAGNCLNFMKRYEDAISYYKKIIDNIDSSNNTALSNIGACYTYLRDDEKAIEYYEKILENDPNYVDAILNMGTAILNLGLPDVAEPYFDEVLAIDKNDDLAIANKGRIRLLADKHEEAIKFFDEALQIKPDSWEALQMKGISLLRLNQHEEALACFNLALKINPTDKQALNNKSVALINLGKFEESLQCCDECLITEPNSIETLQNKIHCLEVLKRSDDAKIWKKKLENVKNPKTDEK